MREALYDLMRVISRIHEDLLSLNDSYEMYFTDKELHFLVIGAIGMAMIFIVHPIFLYLAKKNHVMIISWIYVFTLIIVLTFAIEIGQKISNTGTMEFSDIMFGVTGFLFMFLVFAIIRAIIKGIIKLIKYLGSRNA